MTKIIFYADLGANHNAVHRIPGVDFRLVPSVPHGEGCQQKIQ